MSTTTASTSASTTTTDTLGSLLARADITQAQLEAHLNALSTEARVAEVTALDGKQQKRLWEVCAGAPAFTLEDLVPSSLGETPVHYAGKNSLPMFTKFEKRFARIDGAVVGYNFQAMSFVTGPGYYTVEVSEKDPKELLFNYTKVPARGAAGWPPVKPNDAGLSRFVYKNLHDYNRRVSRDVLIGFATRLGKPMDSYYVLARM
jgi:hypothetical protein